MKTAYLFTIALLSLFALGLSSCGEQIHGNGNIVEVKHDVDDFNEIDISGVFEVELIKGGSKVEVITDENLHEHISIKSDVGELDINTNDKYLQSDQLLLRIFYDDLEEIDVSGAIQITSDKTIKSKSFEFDVSGACDGELDFDVKNLEVEISGGGELTLSGEADEAHFKISGAGDIDAMELEVKEASIDVTGAGEVEIAVSDKLDVDVTGAGDVKYKGDPVITKSISGAGEVKQVK